jgi:hypothetical protein
MIIHNQNFMFTIKISVLINAQKILKYYLLIKNIINTFVVINVEKIVWNVLVFIIIVQFVNKIIENYHFVKIVCQAM